MKTAILGLSEPAIRLARALVEAGQEIHGAADPDLARLHAIERFAPKALVSGSPRELVREPSVEVAVIALPPDERFVLAYEALEAGCHVLVLGPPAHTLREGELLRDLARTRKRLLVSAYRAPSAPGPRRMRELLRSAEARPLRVVTARRTLKQLRLPGLLDSLAEDVALFDYLLGAEPEWVSAILGGGTDELTAHAVATLRYPAEPLLQIEVAVGELARAARVIAHAGTRRFVLDCREGMDRLWVDAELQLLDAEESAEAVITADFLARLASSAAPGGLASEEPRLDVVSALAAFQRSLEAGGAPVRLGAPR